MSNERRLTEDALGDLENVLESGGGVGGALLGRIIEELRAVWKENAALDARIAELEPRAELGRLVDGMPPGNKLENRSDDVTVIWYAEGPQVRIDGRLLPGAATLYVRPADALRALRALQGEKDA